MIMSKLMLTSVLLFSLIICCTSDTNNSVKESATEVTSELIEVNPLLITSFKEAPKGVVRIVTKSVQVEINEAGKFEKVEFESTGSGFFIDNFGTIVTNNHVIAGSVTIDVYIDGESRSFSARILGASECDDLAIIKIDMENNYYFEMFNESPTLGENILAIGFPKGDEEVTFLNGIVSKKETDGSTPWSSIDFAFEHTAEILPGSSGGPILNDNARVIGIAYAGNYDNQEFGIPSVLVKPIIKKILDNEFNSSLSINFEQFEGFGIYLYSVDKNTELYRAGIDGGELITGINDLSIVEEDSAKTFCKILKNLDSKVITLELIETTGDSIALIINSDKSVEILGGHTFISQKNFLGQLEKPIGPTKLTTSFKESCSGENLNPTLDEIFITDNILLEDKFTIPFNNDPKDLNLETLEYSKKLFLIAVKICWDKNFGNYEDINGYVRALDIVGKEIPDGYRCYTENLDPFDSYHMKNISTSDRGLVSRDENTIYIFDYIIIEDNPDTIEETVTDRGRQWWDKTYAEDGCKFSQNSYHPIERIKLKIMNDATDDVCNVEWRFVHNYGNSVFTDNIINGNVQPLRTEAASKTLYLQQYNEDDPLKKVDCGFNLKGGTKSDLNCKRSYGCPTPKYAESRIYYYFSNVLQNIKLNSCSSDEKLEQYFIDSIFPEYGHYHLPGIPGLFYNVENNRKSELTPKCNYTQVTIPTPTTTTTIPPSTTTTVYVDKTPPISPRTSIYADDDIIFSNITSTSATLNWDEFIDDIGIDYYEIYYYFGEDVLLTTSATNTVNITLPKISNGISLNRIWNISIYAVDQAGNHSRSNWAMKEKYLNSEFFSPERND
jgi:S1-C subfamily serine protease